MGNSTSTTLPPWVQAILEEEYAKATKFDPNNQDNSGTPDDGAEKKEQASDRTMHSNDPSSFKGLTLDQFIQLDLGRLRSTLPLSLMDVATLVLVDDDCDGLFSLDDIVLFANRLYVYYMKYSGSTNIETNGGGEIQTVQSLVRGEIAKSFWLLVTANTTVDNNDSIGIETVSDRIVTILIQNRPTQTFTTQPGVDFVDSDTVHTCFRMCAVARSNRVDFQTFFDLMQQAAEDQGFMDLEDGLLDNLLPINIVQTFLNQFLIGVAKMQVGHY